MLSEWICFVIGSVFLLIGLVVFILEVFGIFRFHYALNRMHAAAMGDTLGLAASILGLAVISGFHLVTLKLLIILLFFWVSSPVSSHMLANMEFTINKRIDEELEKCDLSEVEERENAKRSVADKSAEEEE